MELDLAEILRRCRQSGLRASAGTARTRRFAQHLEVSVNSMRKLAVVAAATFAARRQSVVDALATVRR
jgi:hypothetical protein